MYLMHLKFFFVPGMLHGHVKKVKVNSEIMRRTAAV